MNSIFLRPRWKLFLLLGIFFCSAIGLVIPRPFAPHRSLIPIADLPRTSIKETREQIQLNPWTELDIQLDFTQLRDAQEQTIFSLTSSKYELIFTASHDGQLKISEGYRSNSGPLVNAVDQTYGFNNSPNSWHSLSLHLENNRSYFRLDESQKLAFRILDPSLADTLTLGTELRGSDNQLSKIILHKFSAIAHTPFTKFLDRAIERTCPLIFPAILTLFFILFFAFIADRTISSHFSSLYLAGIASGLLVTSVILFHQNDLQLTSKSMISNEIDHFKYQFSGKTAKDMVDESEILSSPALNIKSLAADISFSIAEISDNATIFQTAPGNLGIRLELSPSGQFCLIAGKSSLPNELPFQGYVSKLTAKTHEDYRLQIVMTQGEYISAELNGVNFLNSPYSGGAQISQITLGNGFDGKRPFRGKAEIHSLKYTAVHLGKNFDGFIFRKFFQYLSLAFFVSHLYVTLCLIKNLIIFRSRSD